MPARPDGAAGHSGCKDDGNDSRGRAEGAAKHAQQIKQFFFFRRFHTSSAVKMPKRGYALVAASGGGRAIDQIKRARTVAAARGVAMPPIPRQLRGFVRYGGAWNRFGGNSRQKELKYFDTAISFNVDATGEVPATGQLVLIPQGDTATSRDGKHCVIKSLQMRLIAKLTPSSSATAATNIVIFVVQDTQCNGAAAAVTDVMTSNSLTIALHNLDNSQRFRVLKKIKINLTPVAGVSTAYNTVVKDVEFFKKLNIPLVFSSTTGAITELKSNNIFLLAGSDTETDDLVSVVGNCRVRFSDRS